MIRCLALLSLLCGHALQAQTLEFPSNASLQVQTMSALDSYVLPVGIWDNGTIPSRTIEGKLTRQAWRISTGALTTLQMLRPLREQLRNQQYRIIFECQTEACGGFDFRFAIDTLPPPEMRVNIGDFRFLAAERVGPEGPEAVTLLISRTAQAGYVQISHVGSVADEAPALDITAAPAPVQRVITEDIDLAAQLDTLGRAILRDLEFVSGSAQLAENNYTSLQALAEYLLANPDRTVALVGHTDASGSLAANIALSKRRAASALERLVSDYGVARRQVAAEGMGYLSPVANNLTEAGRDANRRVEVIITSTQGNIR